MKDCPSCGEAAPDTARFCPNCGASLGSGARAEPAEERRFVTILFVDLVGFTERTDRADPEDVRTVLVPYHGRVKEILERHGGTLDKFIGDAVMGVFGAPVAHEDDPERAVRAGLRILEAIDELRALDPAIEVRVAVNSGEAVVTHGTGPQIGEAVAGDVVNTASRMQSLAPPGGLVVGEATHRLVRDAFDAQEQPPAMVKGKAEPLRTWRILAERSGQRGERPAARFVGRQDELDLLLDVHARVERERRLHVVTVVGEPGIGKSRLVEEVRNRVADRSVWLEARCAPYGERSAFEPVARVIREAASIEPSDGPERAHAKLRSFVSAAFTNDDGHGSDEADADWVVSRLRAALGVRLGDGEREPDGEAAGTVPVREMADAFAEVLRWSAAGAPAVLCVHDLHWAHDLLLDLLAWAARRVEDRSVLLVGTGRPELEERPERWPPAVPYAIALRLPPLAADDIERLARSILLEAGTVDVDRGASLSERAGGNPLYAVEFARMLVEHGGDQRVPTPPSVHAMVAARLDAIPTDLRRLVQLASVIGNEFWPPLVARLAGIPAGDANRDLHELMRRNLVTEVGSTLAGHAGYGFAHDLIREVAYSRIPRARRARAHLDVARWLAEQAADRAEEQAMAIAGHLLQAVDLALASRETAVLDAASAEAPTWLLLAAQGSSRVDPSGALELYERAAELAPEASAQRADALTGTGLAGRRSGRLTHQQTLERYREALAIVRSVGDATRTGRALVRVGSQLGAMGDGAGSRAALTEAVEVLEHAPPGRDLASAYAYRAEEAMFAGRSADAERDAERAIEAAGHADEEGGSADVVIMALHIRGDARCSRGDREGLDDLQRAFDLSVREENTSDVITSGTYVADWLWAYEGPSAARPAYDAAIELADRRGMVSQGLWAKTGVLALLCESGEWDRVLELAGDALSVGRDHLDSTTWAAAESHRARALVAVGRPSEAVAADELMRAGMATEDDLQLSTAAFLASAALAAESGDAAGVAAAMGEFERVTRDAPPEYRGMFLAEAVRTCVRGGAIGLAERLVAASVSEIPHHRCARLSAAAALGEARGDRASAVSGYAEAAEAWAAFGVEREARLAREGLARCSVG